MKKVAVINRTNLKNYGSVLQCYALCKAVSDLGYESEIVWEKGNVSKNFDFRPMKILSSLFKLLTHPKLLSSTMTNVNDMNSRKISEGTVALFNQFVQDEITQQFFSHRKLVKTAKREEYVNFICGSDQIWCSTTLYVDPLMYLRFAPKNKRIAYAPSIGRDFIPDYNRRRMKKYISEIPHLSVREKEGQRLIKELTGLNAEVVLDPTLLRQKNDWDELKVEPNIQEKYLLCYFLDAPSKETQEQIFHYAKEKNLEIVALGNVLSICEEKGLKVTYPDCGPKEFLGWIDKTEVVVTDSYHGMLFSVLYEKQFWAVERAYQQYDQSSRQKTVLDMFGVNGRYLAQGAEIPLESEDIDYQKIGEILANERMRAMDFLKKSIESI
ncbi:MAG: polysaccharide pyruvyl transferase family protein [Clostridia bacterium]|nr:polysaccharide pyruvyl transferase family protein [Clostridia bacterium]